MKISSKLQLTVLIIFILFAAGLVVYTSRTTSNTTTSTSTYAASSDISLVGYCSSGYYQIPTESKICSRAPGCGGYNYDTLNTDSWRFGMTGGSESHNACMGDGPDRATGGCAGYVPLCCYEMARTGDYTKCIGYWERLWCAKSQCNEAASKGASDSQCGGSCNCGNAFGSYCGDKPVVPLAQRLGIQQPTNSPQPTNTPRPASTNTPVPTNTSVPQAPTHTTAPNQPTNTPVPSNTPVPNAPTSTPPPQQVPQATVPPADQPIGINPQEPAPSREPLNIDIIPELPSKQEVVANLNSTTAKPLAVVNTSYEAVVSVDQQLELVAESWIFKLRVAILKLFQ
ncbi:MAG: hypothetical protein O3B87_04135 [bacterium]|nr:hypothetical protein [bacterium]